MGRSLSKFMKPWEHCPECGALLLTAPGSLYCSHCGFEEAICEGPVRLRPRPGGVGGQSVLDADPDFETDEFPAPVSEAA